MKRRVRHLLLSLAALALLPPSSAVASPGAVVRDCAQDGTLDGSYSDADKRAALGQIPADLDEYSDCRALIGAAIGGGPKANASSAGGAGGGGSATGTATRKAAAARAKKAREAHRRKTRAKLERELGGRAVDPRDGGVFKAANTANGMPLPVTLALCALALVALAGGALALWRRNPAFADAVKRVAPRRFRL